MSSVGKNTEHTKETTPDFYFNIPLWSYLSVKWAFKTVQLLKEKEERETHTYKFTVAKPLIFVLQHSKII